MTKYRYILYIVCLILISCDNRQAAQQYYNQARSYSEMKQSTKSMEAYLQALDAIGMTSISHDKELQILRGRIYSNIAYSCGVYGDNDLAVKYFNKAGNDYYSAEDTVRYVGNMLELARIYNRDSGYYQKADSLLLKASQYNTDSFLLGRVMDTRSIVLQEREDYYSSLVYAQCAVGFPAKDNETELLPYRHFQLAQLFATIGLTDSVLTHAQYVADNSSNPFYLKTAYNLLATLSVNKAQLSKALELTREQVASTEKSGLQLEDMHNSVNVLLKWERQKRVQLWIGISVCVIALLLTILLVIVRNNNKKETVLNNRIEMLQQRLSQTTDNQERKLINHQLRQMQRVQAFNEQNSDYCKTKEWKDKDLFTRQINKSFPKLLSQLENYGLNNTEQRICVLIMLDRYSNNEIADYCYISRNSISKTKSRIAAKLNTTVSQLRQYLIGII